MAKFNDALAAKKAEEVKAVRHRVMTLAAKRYAQADRTDPFAYSRAMSHIKNGVASFSRPVLDERGEPTDEEIATYYDATGYMEGRSFKRANGEVYQVQAWRNMVRP